MAFYEILAQFAKASAPPFTTEGFMNFIGEAKTYFNTKSLVAANPKEITDILLVDELTIKIILKSQNELDIQQVSRSLRVFSMYLIDERNAINFSNLVSGKRLFKMQSSVIEDSKPVKATKNINTPKEMKDEDVLMAVAELLFVKNEENNRKINLIKKVLGGSADV